MERQRTELIDRNLTLIPGIAAGVRPHLLWFSFVCDAGNAWFRAVAVNVQRAGGYAGPGVIQAQQTRPIILFFTCSALEQQKAPGEGPSCTVNSHSVLLFWGIFLNTYFLHHPTQHACHCSSRSHAHSHVHVHTHTFACSTHRTSLG